MGCIQEPTCSLHVVPRLMVAIHHMLHHIVHHMLNDYLTSWQPTRGCVCVCVFGFACSWFKACV